MLKPKIKLKTALKAFISFLILITIIYHPWNEFDSPGEKDIGKKLKVESSKPRPWYFDGGTVRPQFTGKKLKLWPDEDKGDRILNQLMFTPEKEPLSNKKIYVPKLQNFKFQSGSQIFHELKCPVKKCEVVLNETLADAVVFESVIPKIRNGSFNQVWIFHSLESPLYIKKLIQQSSVNWTASYRTDSDLVTPYGKWVYYDENVKTTALLKNYAKGKTKKVIWFVSNCKSRNKRLEYAKALQKYISVDIYGDCGSKFCFKYFENYCRQENLSKKYKFYLSFENSNCRDYITEKFYRNALSLDLIPIVMGAPKEDYEKVAPHNSFIHVEDFPTPKHLANYLHYLDKNDEQYNSYFLWKGTGEFINTYFMCRLCSMLHAERGNHYYRKINSWWIRPGICTAAFWNATNKDKILKSLIAA